MPLKLKRLNFGEAIGVVKDLQGNIIGYVYPDPSFTKAYGDNLTRIEAETGSLEAAAAAQAAATAANAAAATAQAAATTANSAATAAATATAADARFLSISNSTTTGLTMTATDAGASASIAVSNHTRNYANGTSVAVTGTGGSPLTGLAYSTQYFLFYDQLSLAGGAVTYQTSLTGPTAQTTAAGGSAPNRHFVGSVVTPAALGAPSPGTGAVGVTFDQPIGGNWI